MKSRKLILWNAEMNNKLDLQIFESRCDCLTKVLSSYREGLVILGLYGVKDFNNAYVVEELMEGIISLCEKIYSYLKINKSKTQYKSILGPSSISLLYKNIDNIIYIEEKYFFVLMAFNLIILLTYIILKS